ncbi:MAG: T9SS type A sorting domain-containing protein [Flavobacteriia bacterium]
MKKLILIVLLFLGSWNTEAQVLDNHPWCPDGATWVYRIATQTSVYYNVYSYFDNEIIQGKNTKKISYKVVGIHMGPNPNGGPPATIYTNRPEDSIVFINLYNSNDSVYIFYENAFQFLYNFNASVNDTFLIGNYQNYRWCSDPGDLRYYQKDTSIVTSVTSAIFDNVEFSVFNFNNDNLYWSYGNQIIKNIGGRSAFLASPDCAFNTGFDAGLSCYSDNIRGNIVFHDSFDENTSYMNCHAITTSILENPTSVTPQVFIYPNPTNEALNIIVTTFDEYTIFVYDLAGKLVSKKSANENTTIEVSNLDIGEYFVQIIGKSTSQTLKFIKQ